MSILCASVSARTLVEFADQFGEIGFFVGQLLPASSMMPLLTENFLQWRVTDRASNALSRASSAKMVAVFSPSSILSWLMASPFCRVRQAGWCSWCGEFRRWILGPCRHGELGAELVFVGLNFLAIDKGVAALPLHCQPHGAARGLRGTTTSPIRAATRKPILKNMIGSIMKLFSKTYPSPSNPTQTINAGVKRCQDKREINLKPASASR